MNKYLSTLIAAVAFCGVASGVTPITSIGSNPYFSTELFPQDLLLREGSYFFYSPQYLNSPYWGDIDEPANKPTNTNNDYTITGVEVMRDGGTFKHSGAEHSVFNNFGYAYRVNDNIMTSLELNGDVDALRNFAKGNFTGNTYPTGKTIPFDYEMGHTLATYSMRGMFASHIGNFPIGAYVEAGRKNTMFLDRTLSFDKYAKIDSTTYSDQLIHHQMSGDNARAFWGWAEPGCNHIFGERGTQGDSWFQDQYALGPIYHLNIMGGITTDRIKAGGQFQMIYGHQDQYYWKSSGVLVGNDQQLSDRYYGSYVKDNMAKLTGLGAGQLFANVAWMQGDHYAAKTFFSLRYADSSAGTANADNLKAVSTAKDRTQSVALECLPNITAQLGEYLNFIDVAGIVAYKYSRYNNTQESWVGGGMVQTYQNGNITEGWSSVWENFSYANENMLDLGADINAMFPLFSEGPHNLSLGLRLLGEVRFTYQTKYFGESNANGSNVQFTVNNTRENFSRETMFNTGIMFDYLRGPFQIRFQFTKPVLYSIAPSTTVYDANHKELQGYPLEKSPQLISQKGLNVGLYCSYSYVLPFLR